jgi:hypothetical protein
VRIRRVSLKVSRSPEFRRQYCSALEAALKYHMAAGTILKWVHEGKLAAARVGPGGRLFVDRRQLAAFLDRLPKPGTKTPPRRLKHRRIMALRGSPSGSAARSSDPAEKG